MGSDSENEKSGKDKKKIISLAPIAKSLAGKKLCKRTLKLVRKEKVLGKRGEGSREEYQTWQQGWDTHRIHQLMKESVPEISNRISELKTTIDVGPMHRENVLRAIGGQTSRYFHSARNPDMKGKKN
ncbi:hypothetical protein V2J09_013122 [Rumex salicifolius]